jgi:hypothetical protein
MNCVCGRRVSGSSRRLAFCRRVRQRLGQAARANAFSEGLYGLPPRGGTNKSYYLDV